jgi:hypothetical protein
MRVRRIVLPGRHDNFAVGEHPNECSIESSGLW